MVASTGQEKCIGVFFAIATLFVSNTSSLGDQASDTLPPPVHLTSEQDHQRLMALLHISELRRGPDGDPKSPNAANVDESKVPPYSLPDPLRFNNDKIVKTANDWWTKRRPEICDLLDRVIHVPVPL